ncbi:MAG TPA: hypothetical protein VGM88_15015 [Kofleriaceae bacterium]|jgi:hypothetical protein
MRSPVLFLALAGCGTAGALGQAHFSGQCAESDAACTRRHPQAPIAVGARFFPDVELTIPGTSTPNLRLESADPDVLAVEDGALVAKAPGSTAVLVTTDDGSVVDFAQMWVARPTSLTLATRDGDRIVDQISLAVGEDATLVPTLWAGAQRLGGAGALAWTESTPSLAILRDGSADRRRIRARAPGKTSITVAIGDIETTLDVEVVP